MLLGPSSDSAQAAHLRLAAASGCVPGGGCLGQPDLSGLLAAPEPGVVELAQGAGLAAEVWVWRIDSSRRGAATAASPAGHLRQEDHVACWSGATCQHCGTLTDEAARGWYWIAPLRHCVQMDHPGCSLMQPI